MNVGGADIFIEALTTYVCPFISIISIIILYSYLSDVGDIYMKCLQYFLIVVLKAQVVDH